MRGEFAVAAFQAMKAVEGQRITPPHQPRSLATHDKAQHPSAMKAKMRRRPFRTPLRANKSSTTAKKVSARGAYSPRRNTLQKSEGGKPHPRFALSARLREGPYAASGWDA
jgi:hypothetical protein